MYYINRSDITKTFYGVEFKPNEAKEVAGYINDPFFEKLDSLPEEPPKEAKTDKSGAKEEKPTPQPKNKENTK